MNTHLENFVLMSVGFRKGLSIHKDLGLTIEERRKRSFKEVLFSRPWRPFKLWSYHLVPNPDIYLVGDNIVGHPSTVTRLLIEVEKIAKSSTA